MQDYSVGRRNYYEASVFPIYTILILMFAACSTKVVPTPETDAKAIVPEYVINAKELLGTEERKSEAKLRSWNILSDVHSTSVAFSSYVYFEREYGRTAPYFSEARYSPDYNYVLQDDKAHLTLNITGSKVGRVELTHVGVVSAEEAVMMLGYGPKQLIEHPVKHRNADRSDWFAVIDPYFHIIEIQWFDAEKPNRSGKLGKVTQIRVSAW